MATTTEQPDLLFFFSDQHDGRRAGYAGDPVVETPNLDRIAANGTAFETAVTPCPLCVPARSALLTGRLPSHNGVYGNHQSLHTGQATFLHALTLAGYETVLVGRMHFHGPDQRHGFTKRLVGDICGTHSLGIPRPGPCGFGMCNCMNVIGGGDAPGLGYDRDVVRAALGYLEEDHDRPQCVVVGTYGPHFPYVAPPDLYRFYRERVHLPASWDPETPDPNLVIDGKRQRTRESAVTGATHPVDEEAVLAARAAYCGMITLLDRQIGQVREAWEARLERTGRKGVFLYSSDHGDTCGDHGVFGKQTFLEGSVRVPLVVEGSGLRRGARAEGAASLLDIGPTLCDLGGAEPPPEPDGASLVPVLRGEADPADRGVLSEWIHKEDGRTIPGRMLRKGRWKLVRFDDPAIADQLFDLETDPDELHDRIADEPDRAAALAEELTAGWAPDRIRTEKARIDAQYAMTNAWAHRVWGGSMEQPELWSPPAEQCGLPELPAVP